MFIQLMITATIITSVAEMITYTALQLLKEMMGSSGPVGLFGHI
jgi:hypothetical protein